MECTVIRSRDRLMQCGAIPVGLLVTLRNWIPSAFDAVNCTYLGNLSLTFELSRAYGRVVSFLREVRWFQLSPIYIRITWLSTLSPLRTVAMRRGVPGSAAGWSYNVARSSHLLHSATCPFVSSERRVARSSSIRRAWQVSHRILYKAQSTLSTCRQCGPALTELFIHHSPQVSIVDSLISVNIVRFVFISRFNLRSINCSKRRSRITIILIIITNLTR